MNSITRNVKQSITNKYNGSTNIRSYIWALSDTKKREGHWGSLRFSYRMRLFTWKLLTSHQTRVNLMVQLNIYGGSFLFSYYSHIKKMEVLKMDKPVRVNTRISSRANEWLDNRADETSLSKSALINIAIENYIKEVEVVHGLPAILKELEKQGVDIKGALPV